MGEGFTRVILEWIVLITEWMQFRSLYYNYIREIFLHSVALAVQRIFLGTEYNELQEYKVISSQGPWGEPLYPPPPRPLLPCLSTPLSGGLQNGWRRKKVELPRHVKVELDTVTTKPKNPSWGICKFSSSLYNVGILSEQQKCSDGHE